MVTSSKPDRIQPDRSRLPADDSELVPCPPDLTLTEAQLGLLTISCGIPDWAVSACLMDYLLGATGLTVKRSVGEWRGRAAKYVRVMWANPDGRPRKPEMPLAPEALAAERRARLAAAVMAEETSAAGLVGESPPPEVVERWRTMGQFGRLLRRMAAPWLPAGEGSSGGSESAPARRP